MSDDSKSGCVSTCVCELAVPELADLVDACAEADRHQLLQVPWPGRFVACIQ